MSTFAQVKAHCLTTPSHYLNWCGSHKLLDWILKGKKSKILYSAIRWVSSHLKSPAIELFVQQFIQPNSKQYIKAQHDRSLWGESTSDVENVSILWCHHAYIFYITQLLYLWNNQSFCFKFHVFSLPCSLPSLLLQRINHCVLCYCMLEDR